MVIVLIIINRCRRTIHVVHNGLSARNFIVIARVFPFLKVVKMVVISSESTRISVSSSLVHFETFLLNIYKFPILASQLNGYLPLSITTCNSNSKSTQPQSQKLVLKYLSLPFIYCFLLIVLVLPSIIYKYGDISESYTKEVSSSVTDGITLNAVATLGLLNPIVHRVRGILFPKSSLEFWKLNCLTLHKHFETDFFKYKLVFLKLRSSLKMYFIVTFSTSFLISLVLVYIEFVLHHFGIHEGTGGVTSFALKGGLSTQLFFLVLAFFVLVHPISILTVTSYLKVYCICLRIISDKFELLVSQVDMKLHTKFISVQSYELNEIIQNAIEDGISKYEAIYKLMKLWNFHFSMRILMEVSYNIVMSLGMSYYCWMWSLERLYSSAFCLMAYVLMSLVTLHHLGAVGSDLKQENVNVLNALQQVPVENLSPELRNKVLN